MSLWELPFLLTGAIGAWLALTPPNPPPSKSECTKREGTEKAFGSVVVYHAFIWKMTVVSSVLVSIAFIILDHTPLRDVFLSHVSRPSAESSLSAAIFVLGWFTTLSSGLLRDYCYKTLGRMFTFEITIREGHQLVTIGPYNYVRHPSYSGIVLGVIGTLLMTFGPGTWYWEAGIHRTVPGAIYMLLWIATESFVLFSILSRAPIEDALLKKQFGKEWEDWAARVRYRVVPGVF